MRNNFKGLFSVLTAIVIAASLTACQNDTEQSPGNASSQGTGTSSAPASNTSSSSSSSSESTETNSTSSENTGAAPDNSTESGEKILIAYFSRCGNTNYPDDVDASASASIVVDNGRFGTTEYVAKMIQDEVGGDIHLIQTVNPYTADFDELRTVNHNEMSNNYLPDLKDTDLDISGYDTVFVGYPVWATDVPQAVISFLNKYDFSGKTVIPFCTHDGYGAGSSYNTIATASKAQNTENGLAIEAKDVPGAKSTVASWLNSIGISESSGNSESAETALKITIDDVVLYGVLYDTALAREIKEYFPLTISMVGFGGREYYGGVDFYPQNLTDGQRNFENGDITYCEAHRNMAIFYAQTDNPNLSVDVIPIGKVTSDLSVFETLGGHAEITFSLA